MQVSFLICLMRQKLTAKMTGMSKRTYLREVNPYLICPLCRGYLIDATTVVECLHSFCRSCILKHLRSKAQCPSCLHLLNKAKPNIKADKALQDIVYKLVPGLYHKEMRKRREFYKKHPEHADSATPEQRGEDVSGRLIFVPEDAISLSLEYLPPGADPLALILSTNDADTIQSNTNNTQSNNKNEDAITHDCSRRYLQCPALVTIAHLKKFLALKYSVDVTRYCIEICHRRAPLPEHWTLMDVAYIYAWKRNAPLRFFYRIMQEEQRLEAPINDRPSTPGVGASLSAVDNGNNKNESDENQVQIEKEESLKVNKVSKKNDQIKNQLTVTNSTNTSVKVDKKLPSSPISKESAKAVKVNNHHHNNHHHHHHHNNQTSSIDDETKQIKSPIKILKNSEGRYEVLRTSNNQTSPESSRTVGNVNEKKTPSPEFSVVSIGDGPNSNGVKITLKQCSPGSGLSSSKPKIVSNVLMRNGQTEKILKSHEKNRQKADLIEKQEKHKRKVTFIDKIENKVKDINEEIDRNKKITEQSDKKEFLHGFRLTAKQPWNDDKNSNKTVKIIDNTIIKSPEKQENKKNNQNDSNTIYSIKNKNTEKLSPPSSSSSSLKTETSKRFLNGIVKDLDTNESKIDVYAFPSEPPTLPAGAVKRKCPPGLPIFEMGRKRPHLQGQIRKKTNPTPVKIAKKQQDNVYSKRVAIKDNTQSNIIPIKPPATTTTTTTAISDNTRNLLDGCGLNIPASLSITLTAPKSPNHNTSSSSASSSSTDVNNLKDNQTILSGKVNPSITLNDRSVDPRVLKALKTGQIRMPVASSRQKMKQQPILERSQPVKRKKDDILDLSGTRKLDIHPLRIPQPVSKFKSKSPILPTASSHQVVTLTGGQKYYRAPPGSLTPAVHRVSDYPQTPPSRGPVYAPSCFSHNSNNRNTTTTTNNNISSVFPSLQSLYALSQAPNLQQFQMDNRLRLPQQPESTTSNGPNKSHLAAQCAPLKPARSSFASLAVPIVKQSPPLRPITFTNTQTTELTKIKTKEDNIQNSSLTKETQEKIEKLKQSSPITSNSKQEAASTSSCIDSNSQEAASPRVSSTVSPSPPPNPVINNSINSSHTDEVSSGSISSNKSEVIVTSTKSPESPDSSSIVNENSNSSVTPTTTTTTTTAAIVTTPIDDQAPSSKDEKIKEISKDSVTTEKEIISEEKNDKVGDTTTNNDDDDDDNDGNNEKKIENNIKVDVKQMTSEVFQKRLLAAFPSNEWANNPIAAKHLGNLLKSLTSMQTDDQGEKKNQSKETKEIITTKCVKDILPKTNVEVTD
ncbi:protein suppressor 2 of zeste-like isoform X2 [Leptopilina boulardi]|uniref:protein suppressor 2 of zeste-like isoform X2 n=1 Tax=Leptopilina boulardi TaxID=63433 RepID=UPI0021F59E96|nr:protein suppressor 2 of zeste-like isoform X2 [Leptopilina boulardi]